MVFPASRTLARSEQGEARWWAGPAGRRGAGREPLACPSRHGSAGWRRGAGETSGARCWPGGGANPACRYCALEGGRGGAERNPALERPDGCEQRRAWAIRAPRAAQSTSAAYAASPRRATSARQPGAQCTCRGGACAAASCARARPADAARAARPAASASSGGVQPLCARVQPQASRVSACPRPAAAAAQHPSSSAPRRAADRWLCVVRGVSGRASQGDEDVSQER